MLSYVVHLHNAYSRHRSGNKFSYVHVAFSIIIIQKTECLWIENLQVTADSGMTNGGLRVMEQSNVKEIERNLTSGLEAPGEEEEEEQLTVAQRQTSMLLNLKKVRRERERERGTCR